MIMDPLLQQDVVVMGGRGDLVMAPSCSRSLLCGSRSPVQHQRRIQQETV